MENLAYKFVLMRFPAFGNHVTNCNQGLSQSKTENPGNEVGNEVVLVRSADWIKDKSYFTALTLQGVADLYLYG